MKRLAPILGAIVLACRMAAAEPPGRAHPPEPAKSVAAAKSVQPTKDSAIPEETPPTAQPSEAQATALPIEQKIAEQDRPLRYNLALEGPLTAGLTVAWALLTGFESELAPDACHWCEPGYVDGSVRNSLVWKSTSIANDLSSLLGYIVGPSAMIGWTVVQAKDKITLFEDLGIIGEAIAATMAFGPIVRYAVGRQRPFAHFAPPGSLTPTDYTEANTSFFSGHTSFAFANAVATGTIASIRDLSGAPVIWAGGLAVAGLTGYLRIAADRHYLTDVVTGAVVGSALGMLIPFLHKTGFLSSQKSRGQTNSPSTVVAVVPQISSELVGLSVRWARW